jgi:hypothetical protein
VGAAEVDLSDKNLGAADGELVLAWLRKPGVSVNEVVLGGGLRLDFADTAAAETLEASGLGLGPGEAAVVARWLGAAAAVVAVDLSDNSLFGTREEERADRLWCGKKITKVRLVDAEQGGWQALCAALGGLAVGRLGLRDVGLGPVGLGALVAALAAPTGARLRGAVRELDVSGNELGGAFETMGGRRVCRTPDAHLAGLEALLGGLRVGGLRALSLGGVGLGPGGAAVLAAALLPGGPSHGPLSH